jgi:hypothetical protein
MEAMTMKYYEIYAGGERGGEIVIKTEQSPNDDGIVVLTADDYDNAFSSVGRSGRGTDGYHENYDVTTYVDCVVLHPSDIAFDDQRIDEAARRGLCPVA